MSRPCEGCSVPIDTIYICANDHREVLGAQHVYHFCWDCWNAHRESYAAIAGDQSHQEVMH